MTPAETFSLIVIFFFTSVVSVVTGSTSLITVPVMLQLGIEPRVAVATNMLALVFMSLGGSLSFRSKNVIDRHRAPLLIILTLASSVLGASILLVIPSRTIPFIVAILMVAVASVSMIKPNADVASPAGRQISTGMEITGYIVTFVLGVYGGFLSGGYVTLLTAAFALFFGMTFVQAVSTTKVVNVFSSLVATAIFMWYGLVDYKLGILLGITMFAGALIGGRLALRLNNLWIRRIFLTAVVFLALKILIYDLYLVFQIKGDLP